ncbi:DUF4118 domain-containing protein [Embleya hyalina]|uniref:Sensor protein KdpD transmembrane domain-containing protein n=1 Tax=Embleya hyalina TaxID=516124 RepID=A0A401YMN7_9ACTN|nr:DUF4118 domain-containing protein [Embleya hyalina]GCD95858.1 hypothetical protein EHYA_03542 [Embleya hyalina]
MPRYPRRDRVAVIAAVVVPVAVAGILAPFRAHFASVNVALCMVVVVVAVAANGHRLAGALTALSATLWFDFFFSRPYGSLGIARSADVLMAVLLLLVGLAVSRIAARARRLQMIARTDADHRSRVRDVADVTRSSTSPDAVVDAVGAHLIALLDLRGCRFEYGRLIGRPPRLEQDGSVSVGPCARDVDRHGLPAEEIELRVYRGDHFHGRFMLDPTPDSRPSLRARLVAVTLADQVGSAFEHAAR